MGFDKTRLFYGFNDMIMLILEEELKKTFNNFCFNFHLSVIFGQFGKHRSSHNLMNLQEIEQKVKAKCISNNIFQESPNVADFSSFLNNYSASQRCLRCRVTVKKRKKKMIVRSQVFQTLQK